MPSPLFHDKWCVYLIHAISYTCVATDSKRTYFIFTMACKQFGIVKVEWFKENGLIEKFLLGFLTRHRIPAVLLSVMNGFLLASDAGHSADLLHLDLRAAFDADRSICCDLLERWVIGLWMSFGDQWSLGHPCRPVTMYFSDTQLGLSGSLPITNKKTRPNKCADLEGHSFF